MAARARGRETASDRDGGTGPFAVILALPVAAALLAGGAVSFEVELFRGLCVLVAAGLALLALAVGLPRGRAALAPGWLHLGFGVLVVWLGLVSALSAHTGSLATYQFGKLLGLAVVLAATSALDARAALRTVARTSAVSLLGLAAIALAGHAFGLALPGFGYEQPLELGFGNANILAGTVAVAAMWLLAPAFGSDTRADAWLARTALVAGAAIVLACESRSAIFWVGLGVAGFVFVWLRSVRGWTLARSLALAAALVATLAAAVWLGGSERFARRVARLIDIERLHTFPEPGRRITFWIVLDRTFADPLRAVAGRGLGSGGRDLLAVSPPEYAVAATIRQLYIHNEFLELWSDGGLLALGGFLALLGTTLVRLVRTLIRTSSREEPPGTRAAERRRALARHAGHRGDHGRALWALALSTSIAMWCALGMASLSTRHVGSQLFLVLALGLGWQLNPAPGDPPRRVSGPLVATGLVAVALGSLALVLPTFRASQLLLEAKRTVSIDQDLDRAVGLLERARAWHPGEPEIALERLNVAVWQDDLEAARTAYEALGRYAPFFPPAPHLFARALARRGEFGAAARELRALHRVAPYDFEALLALPFMAYAAGDRNLLETASMELVAAAIETLEWLEMRGLEVERRDATGAAGVFVTLADGGTLWIRRSSTPGLLFPQRPETLAEGRTLARESLRRLLTDELGAERTRFLDET